MRFLTLLVLAYLLIGTPSVYAASKVLVPDDNNTGSDMPNLGLGVTPKKPKPEDVIPPKKTPEDNAPKLGLTPLPDTHHTGDTAFTPIKPPEPKKSTLDKITPGGSLTKDPNLQRQQLIEKLLNKKNNTSIKPDTPEKKELLKIFEGEKQKYVRPPRIMDEHQSYGMTGYYSDRLPLNLTVALMPSYTWSTGDVEQISKHLGYKPSQTPQQCQLRLDGKLKNDKGTFRGIVYAGQYINIKYDGAISSLTFQPRAVCNPPQGELPQNGGIIMRVGNKLSVQLMRRVTCPPPAKSAAVVEITYNGESQASCVYK